jgi:hypothetical protein
VVLALESPQRADLAPDLAAALDAEPEAGAFFDALATFCRKGYRDDGCEPGRTALVQRSFGAASPRGCPCRRERPGG